MSVVEQASEWIANDPDFKSREDLSRLLERAKSGEEQAAIELAERFSGPLEFGTAGLRGVLGAGQSRMNLAVVRRTTWGLAQYLLEHADTDVRKQGVAIGYDGRRMSREFAVETCGVLAALGIRAHLSPILCPTPVCAYATTYLGASASIMVTASHNPPEYNGYKVYWQNGAQIIPPHDAGIAQQIERAPVAKDIVVMDLAQARAADLVRDFPMDLEQTYLAKVQSLSRTREGDRQASIVYTPLHGVGNRLIRMTLERAGFSEVHSVPLQAEPDGEFPTVQFPNPEEKGALDLAYALAAEKNADLILASDPDVDRLAVAAKDNSGKFVQLTGNQVGVLLGHYLLTSGDQGDNRLALASCVSSPQLGAISRKLGVHYEETLTGFKWIANRALELEPEGKQFVFGYEEALGYTVGPLVRDKDGIGAALLFAELWAKLRKEGRTLFDELEKISRTFGHYASGQLSVTMKGQDGSERIASVMKALRQNPPQEVGPLSVVVFSDAEAGIRTPRGAATQKLALPPSNVLFFELEGGSRIIARPSGTEPKIKIYFDVCETIAEDETLAAADKRAQDQVARLTKAFAVIAGLDA